MSYIKKIHIGKLDSVPKTMQFLKEIPSLCYVKDIEISAGVTIIAGDNGTGKSTLVNALAKKLNLWGINEDFLHYNSFESTAEVVSEHIDIDLNRKPQQGLFLCSEDFGDYIRGSDVNFRGNGGYEFLEEDIEDLDYSERIQLERENALKNPSKANGIHLMTEKSRIKFVLNQIPQGRYQKDMVDNYGTILYELSHGEAYLRILEKHLTKKGFFIFDEPDSALSPIRQLSLIYLIQENLKNFDSQFIIATHSPMLMAYPEAMIYEITENGIEQTPLNEVDHYALTKSFLNNPELYLKNL